MSGNETGCLTLIRHGERTCGLQFHAAVTRTGVRHGQGANWADFPKAGARPRDEQRHVLFADFLHRLFGV